MICVRRAKLPCRLRPRREEDTTAFSHTTTAVTANHCQDMMRSFALLASAASVAAHPSMLEDSRCNCDMSIGASIMGAANTDLVLVPYSFSQRGTCALVGAAVAD